MMKKYVQASLLAALAIFSACNASEEAFNAPEGATITFNNPAVELQFAAPGEVILLATIKVQIPIGVDSVDLEPGNKIQGVISCGRCNLYVFKDGVETYLPQASLLDPVASGSFTFTTDEQGLYTFAFGVLSPVTLGFVNADGDILGYTDLITADIRVAQTGLEVSANPAE